MKDFTIKQDFNKFTKALEEASVDLSNRSFSTAIKSSSKNVDLSKLKISSKDVLEEYSINTTANTNNLENDFNDSFPDEETLKRTAEIYDDYGATKDFYNKQKSDDEIIIGGTASNQQFQDDDFTFDTDIENVNYTFDTDYEDDDFNLSLDENDESLEDKSRYIDIDELEDLQNDVKSSIDFSDSDNKNDSKLDKE